MDYHTRYDEAVALMQRLFVTNAANEHIWTEMSAFPDKQAGEN